MAAGRWRFRQSPPDDAELAQRRKEMYKFAGLKEKDFWRGRLADHVDALTTSLNNLRFRSLSNERVKQRRELLAEVDLTLSRLDDKADPAQLRKVLKLKKKLERQIGVYEGDITPSRKREPKNVDEAELDDKVKGLVDDAVVRRAETVARHLEDTRPHGLRHQYSGDELSEFLADAYGGDQRAVEALEKWAEAAFGHKETTTKSGMKYRTSRIDVDEHYYDEDDPQENYFMVTGLVEAFNEESGQWETVGDFERVVQPDAHNVGHSHLYIGEESDYVTDDEFANGPAKNGGFATVFNGQAYEYYRKAGIKQVALSTAADGKYVWGRVGFRPESHNEKAVNKQIAGTFANELDAFNRGKKSIIDTPEQASLIRQLIANAEAAGHGPDSPSFMEFALVLDPTGADREHAEKVGEWFKQKLPFNGGVFHL